MVKVVRRGRYITLGRCLLLMLTSLVLAEAIEYVLAGQGVPARISIFGWLIKWSPFVAVAIFAGAFRAFSSPADDQGAA